MSGALHDGEARYSHERLQPVELLVQALGEARHRPFTSSKRGKPLLTLMGQLQALMTSSSISSGSETIVNSASCDIGNFERR